MDDDMLDRFAYEILAMTKKIIANIEGKYGSRELISTGTLSEHQRKVDESKNLADAFLNLFLPFIYAVKMQNESVKVQSECDCFRCHLSKKLMSKKLN